MKFLIDASLPPSMVDAFIAEAHEAVHADDLGLGHAADSEIGDAARASQRAVVTRDFDFADVRNYRPPDYYGIVVLTIPKHRGSTYMRYLLAKLFEYVRSGGEIEGKLLILDADRIRVRE